MRRALCIAAALVVFVPAPAGASADAARRGAEWIAGRQQPNGAFFRADARAGDVAEGIVALAAAGVTGAPAERALSYVERGGPASTTRAAYAARVVLALVATARDPRAFGGFDYVAKLSSFYDPSSGRYDAGLYSNAVAALGVLAAGEPLPERALLYMRANQCPGGGFAHDEGCRAVNADVDTTAVVLMALVGAGVSPDDLARARARSFLVGAQNADGGFGLESGKPTNANSTGLALSATAALGEAPWRKGEGPSAVDALVVLQHPSGGFRHLGTDPEPNAYATVQAVPGVAARALPFRPGPPPPAAPVPREPRAREPSAATARPPQVRSSTPFPGARAPAPAADAEAEISTAPAQAAPNRAGVVVRSGEREVQRVCVAFDERQITGYELLLRSGLDLSVEAAGLGAAICRIGADGCERPRESCFCEFPSFWHYWTRDPGDAAWTFSKLGAASRTVRPGSTDAWVWTSSDDPPPRASDVCAGGASRAASRRRGVAGGYAGFAALAAALVVTAAILRRRPA